MSKKMLKRSLALGALMAFVITGSALAMEETEFADEEKYVHKNGVSSSKMTGDGCYLEDIDSANAYVYNDNSNGVVLGYHHRSQGANANQNVTFNKLKIVSLISGIYLSDGAGENTIKANVIEISGIDFSGAVQANADNTKLTISGFNKFTIGATGLKEDPGIGVGIRNENNGCVLDIIGDGSANSILDITAASNGIYSSNVGAQTSIRNVGTLNVTTLGIDENEDVKGHAVAVKDGIVDVQADNITLNAAGATKNTDNDEKDSYAIYVEKGTATFDADNTTINGTVKVKANESGSDVTLKGQKITIDGKGGRGVNVVNGTVTDVPGTATVTLGDTNTQEINIKNAT